MRSGRGPKGSKTSSEIEREAELQYQTQQLERWEEYNRKRIAELLEQLQYDLDDTQKR